MDGKNTYYSNTITIEVKNPYITTGPSLTHYFGNGGTVNLPSSLAITEIGSYAFSNFDYVPKGEDDIIDDENPETLKMFYIGDDTIEEVIIPEGVETIGAYAFANLTALKKVTLPSTLVKIDQGAFYGCTSLTTVAGIENVKFINQGAFTNCSISGTLSLDKAIAVADYAFAYNVGLKNLVLSEATQSVSSYAFAGDKALENVTIKANKIKLGICVFSDCTSLKEISLNAAVIPTGTFDGCSSLNKVTIGNDVNVIGENAFRGTVVKSFTVAQGNTTYYPNASLPYLQSSDGTKILLVAPGTEGEFKVTDSKITTVGYGAFSGCSFITSVELPGVTVLEDYAFADCIRLSKVSLGKLSHIGDYAFAYTKLTELPDISGMSSIGDYSFWATSIKSVTIPDGFTVGEGAFLDCLSLENVVIGNNVVIGDDAFRLNNSNNWSYDSIKKDNADRIYYIIYTSPLHSLSIGNNAQIGSGAFYGAAELESITLGSGATIGDKAFYNNNALKLIDLTKVKSIGEAAFSGDVLYDYTSSSFTIPAIDENGYYILRYFSPDLVTVDLSDATFIGKDAFAFCRSLKSVKLNKNLTEVSDNTFINCPSLSEIDLTNIEKIGANAFAECDLNVIDLPKATYIGEYAFLRNENVSAVKLSSEKTTVEEGAFAYCSTLKTVENLKNASYVGDYSFAYTVIVNADLTSAEYIGEHAFIKEEITDFTVVLGNALKDIGDNPFAFCRLEKFSSKAVESFNGVDYESVIYTYDISEAVKVINGVLYRVVPKGLELVAFAGNDKVVAVADDTVRLSSLSFAGSGVSQVVLPYTVSAIGHKAFYGCDRLVMINFNSYNAPVLEEAYDETYFLSYENIPATGEYEFYATDGVTEVTYQGLGIVPYYMWNTSDAPYVIYYGASFVDYIGHIEDKITMVRPSNGLNYDSFVFTQYFNTFIDGTAAADEITLAAISAINKIPAEVKLSDKAIVEAARAAYDKISTDLQRSLVSNYAILTQAENRIKDLEFLANGENNETKQEPEVNDKLTKSEIVIIVLGSVALLLAVSTAVFVILFINKGKKKGPRPPKKSSSTINDAITESEVNAISDSEPEADSEIVNAEEADSTVEPVDDNETVTEQADSEANNDAE